MVSIVSFWNVINLSVGSKSLIAEKMFLCAFSTFKFVLPLEGRSWRVTGFVIRWFRMTVVVAISIVRWVIVLFALGGNSGFFNVMISISGLCSSFLFLLNIVVFSLDEEMFSGVSKVVVFFLTVLSFSTSSSKTSLKLGGWTVGSSSRIVLVEMVL